MAGNVIERRIKERIAACEKGGQRCSVPSFFSGLKYFEIAQMEIKDVRLVGQDIRITAKIA